MGRKILFITSDQQRYDALGCNGGLIARTPNIDALAATGINYNRAHPQKHDCFVLDFQNNAEAITFAFQDYYRTTLLAEETDPNKLHDLKTALDIAQVYTPEQVEQLKKDRGIYLVDSSRINVAGINDANVEYLADSLAAVIKA